MTKLVLQGNALTKDIASDIAEKVAGSLDYKPDFSTITVTQRLGQEQLKALREDYAFDINEIPEEFDPSEASLLVTDMDSTLISIECVDEIAYFINAKPQVSAITEAAMRGEIDFETSLRQRVALLKGLDFSVLEQVFEQRLSLNSGAKTML